MESNSQAQREKKNRGSDYGNFILWEAYLNVCSLIINPFSSGVEALKFWPISLY